MKAQVAPSHGYFDVLIELCMFYGFMLRVLGAETVSSYNHMYSIQLASTVSTAEQSCLTE